VQEDQVRRAIDRLRADPTLVVTLTHALGSGDVVTAQARANPSRDDASALAGQLRQRKFDLQKRQVELSATLRVALASQNPALADQSLQDLQQTATQLAETEEALDDMLGLLRRGADRQADRRSRAAALELGAYRLQTIEQRFRDSGIKDVESRLTVGRAAAKPPEGGGEQGSIEIKFDRRAKQ
jgi:hypothetical protein